MHTFEYWRKLYEAENSEIAIYSNLSLIKKGDDGNFKISSIGRIELDSSQFLNYPRLAITLKKYFSDIDYQLIVRGGKPVIEIRLPEYFKTDDSSEDITLDFNKLRIANDYPINLLDVMRDRADKIIFGIQNKSVGWEFILKDEWNSLPEEELFDRLLSDHRRAYLNKHGIDESGFASDIDNLAMGKAVGGSFSSESDLKELMEKLSKLSYVDDFVDEAKKTFKVSREVYNIDTISNNLEEKVDSILYKAKNGISKSDKDEIIKLIKHIISELRPKGGKILTISENALGKLITGLESKEGLIEELLEYLG